MIISFVSEKYYVTMYVQCALSPAVPASTMIPKYTSTCKLKGLRSCHRIAFNSSQNCSVHGSSKNQKSACFLDSDSIRQSVRSAQAVELFRQNYYNASNASVNISLTDISQVMLSERVRPSAFIGLLGGLGYASGTIARIVPVPGIAKVFTKAIDDAAQQQLNDSVRSLSIESSDDGAEEVKEMLKFHRDIRSETETDFDGNSQAQRMSIPSSLGDVLKSLDGPTVLTTALYQAFKVTEKI